MAILIVFSRVLRLALVIWLGISALAWGVIFAMIGLFKIIPQALAPIFSKQTWCASRTVSEYLRLLRFSSFQNRKSRESYKAGGNS